MKKIPAMPTTHLKSSDVIQLTFLASPEVVASLELKILAKLCAESARDTRAASAVFAFLATNLAAISEDLAPKIPASLSDWLIPPSIEETGGLN